MSLSHTQILENHFTKISFVLSKSLEGIVHKGGSIFQKFVGLKTFNNSCQSSLTLFRFNNLLWNSYFHSNSQKRLLDILSNFWSKIGKKLEISISVKFEIFDFCLYAASEKFEEVFTPR